MERQSVTATALRRQRLYDHPAIQLPINHQHTEYVSPKTQRKLEASWRNNIKRMDIPSHCDRDPLVRKSRVFCSNFEMYGNSSNQRICRLPESLCEHSFASVNYIQGVDTYCLKLSPLIRSHGMNRLR